LVLSAVEGKADVPRLTPSWPQLTHTGSSHPAWRCSVRPICCVRVRPQPCLHAVSSALWRDAEGYARGDCRPARALCDCGKTHSTRTASVGCAA